ncbi:MAG TPA: hypothetical protein DD791_10425 [Syntrophomonas sp.]|nr:hypothetical protein [Syntrophomonas sp.]
MGRTKIEWTDATWNPLTGCTKVSPGCKNCYAERMAKRLQAMNSRNYINGFKLTLHEDCLQMPLKWKKPQNIFVNSMSDLFHHDVPEEFILKVFDIMGAATWHRFQVLTKRSERLAELAERLPWANNIWMGVSVENQDYISRIEHLRRTPAIIKFISFEPLIGPVNNIDLANIDWVIVGGESGPGARPLKQSWVTAIRDKCLQDKVPFFFKQWGGTNKKQAGRVLEGKIWNETPIGTSSHCCSI